jgi:cleavage stimulation factor subunit 2
MFLSRRIDTSNSRAFKLHPPRYQDHETAASAVRNLNNVDVGGRPLRIDLADSDPFLEGKTTVRGELVDSGESRAQWRERERDDFRNGPAKSPPDPNIFMAGIPPGVPIAPGSTALDTISNTLGTMNPSQLIEVLAQVKVCPTCVSVANFA